MQFTDGGSRADAIARLGAAAYTDAAGVVYTDEVEAGECLPLLLAPETAPDPTDDDHSPTEDMFVFESPAPSSPLALCTPPASAPAPRTPTSARARSVASSPRALLSIPARAAGSSLSGDADAPAYLHVAFGPPSMSPARGKVQRRRPAPLALPLPAPTGLRPASAIGFDDSFVPSHGALGEVSAVRDAEMGFRGLSRAARRE